jgi:8-oxo-dGTP pyrophosphatase MutT (NUDIX family)
MSLLERIEECRRWERPAYRPFRVAGSSVGWVTRDFARRLAAFPKTFRIDDSGVDLAPELDSYAARSAAMAEALGRLREEGLIKGWRNEPYPVGTDFYGPPLLQMERAAVPLFGVRAYGVHLNGFTGRGSDLKLWVGRRSKTKQTAPGKLDHLVAGGQPLGLSLMENLVKECAEEAGMAASLARSARPAGFVSYVTERLEGLRNDMCFVFDIELPADFRPVNTDGEIEEFYLWPIEQVRQRLTASDDFKFNVALVNIDFLVRQGYLSPDEPGYVDIVEGLRL